MQESCALTSRVRLNRRNQGTSLRQDQSGAHQSEQLWTGKLSSVDPSLIQADIDDVRRIGFVQGRLSEIADGKIQVFPWNSWEEEFEVAGSNSFEIIEWTIDSSNFWENPILTEEGQLKIIKLSKRWNLKVASVTADYFMENPFWNLPSERRAALEMAFTELCISAASIGSKVVVVPLVDNGCPTEMCAFRYFVDFLNQQNTLFENLDIKIGLELELPPLEVELLLRQLPPRVGINYDIGNSAALRHDSSLEIETYGPRIVNVHVKDRLVGGTTVPLGSGSADFSSVFNRLKKSGYSGNYILQTARSQTGEHLEDLLRYRKFVLDYLRL